MRDPETGAEDRVPDLAGVADHSLPWERRRRLLARAKTEPSLAEDLRGQRRALEMIEGASGEIAPEELHDHVAALFSRARRSRIPVPIPLLGGAAASACAAVAVAVALLLGGGGSLTLGQAVASAKGPILLPAPLQTIEQGASSSKGWRPEGVRVDHVAGRLLKTVFYASRDGATAGYTIIGGRPLRVRGGTVTSHDDIRYRHLRVANREVTTWVAGGHTRVLSGNADPRAVLAARTADAPTL